MFGKSLVIVRAFYCVRFPHIVLSLVMHSRHTTVQKLSLMSNTCREICFSFLLLQIVIQTMIQTNQSEQRKYDELYGFKFGCHTLILGFSYGFFSSVCYTTSCTTITYYMQHMGQHRSLQICNLFWVCVSVCVCASVLYCTLALFLQLY